MDPISNASNLRPLSIFASYFATSFLLLSLILTSFRRASAANSANSKIRPNSKVALFSLLTVASLGSTWYYMLRYFHHSYAHWSALQSPAVVNGMRIGDWLRDVKLFKDAWEIVVISPERWWWSQQIFLGTCAWSVFLGVEGHKRNIPHLWAYMLLGQLVAISFVTNLFFLAALLHPPQPLPTNPKPSATASASKWPSLALYLLFALPLVVAYAFVYCTSDTAGTAAFLPTLLIPHVLLFLPLALPSVAAVSAESEAGKAFWRRTYTLCSFLGLLLHTKTLYTIFSSTSLETGGRGILDALYSHPAVSSVGWDVIMFSLSVAAWCGARGGWVKGVAAWVMMVVGGAGVGADVFAGELR